jgi:hypothetical protein
MRSLKIIAARIPAQSQQSFMSMQVEQFANPDTNNAYVSIFQFYLQGSDLDIDAVSMQTYDIDEDGILQGHSPYYSLESEDQRKASESLPFPNNRKLVESASVKVSECTLEQLLKKGIIGGEGTNSLIEIFKGKKVKDKVLDNGDIIEIFNGGIAGKVNIKLNLNNPQQIRTLGKLIEDFNRSGVFVKSEGVARNSLLKLINDSLFPGKAENEMLLDNKSIERIENTIINMINNHNTYLSRVNDRRREHIIKNYVTTQLFDIIEDPINREQADSSVDVVTGPVKDLSNSSPKATVQDVFTPGNVVNKFQSIAENMIGKDGIAICATGLKSFFALTELEQLMLAQGRGKELLFNVRIAGKTYHGLANGFSPEFKAAYEYGERDSNQGSYDPEVANYLIEQLWEADAANNMSAFLGLSTDNAKELVLAKINAGTATMGMYLYGLSIGVPIGELYRLMTSPLAFKLTELTKGDAFSYTPGVNGILGALRYLREEPSKYLSKFNDVKDPLDKKAHFDQPVDYLYREINKQILKRDHVSKFETEYLTALAKTLK